jgi:ketosteroid isomerase-like protein
MIDETRIRDWLAMYRHAWSTDDPGEIAALFSEDVRYFTAPYRPPLEGVEAVAAFWLGEQEAEIPWSFEYQVLAQEGDLFVVRAVTTYPQGGSRDEDPAQFHNLWLVTLGEDGRASEFVEYFMLVE